MNLKKSIKEDERKCLFCFKRENTLFGRDDADGIVSLEKWPIGWKGPSVGRSVPSSDGGIDDCKRVPKLLDSRDPLD